MGRHCQGRGRVGHTLLPRLLVISSLLAMPARAFAQEESGGATVIAGGLDLAVGLLGVQLAHRLGDLPLAAGLGLGVEGIAPKLQIDLMSFGDFNLHVGGGVLYNPWGFLVFSQGSVLTIGMIGVQRWPYRWQHGGIFLNGDVELVRQIRGHAEGGHQGEWIPTIGGQIGAAF